MESLFFLQKIRIWPYTGINSWASDPDKESFRPIHHLPIHTDIDSNRFLGLLTIPIPIFRYEYYTNTDTDFLKNTDILIPIILIIPINGLSLHSSLPLKWVTHSIWSYWIKMFLMIYFKIGQTVFRVDHKCKLKGLLIWSMFFKMFQIRSKILKCFKTWNTIHNKYPLIPDVEVFSKIIL